MIALIATLKAKPGKGAELEKAALALVAKVRSDEPGNALYVLCRGDAPDTYVMLERYHDMAAIDAHRASPHYKEAGKAMADFLDGRPEVTKLTEI
jgi:quinol monooxygenase YgiN